MAVSNAQLNNTLWQVNLKTLLGNPLSRWQWFPYHMAISDMGNSPLGILFRTLIIWNLPEMEKGNPLHACVKGITMFGNLFLKKTVKFRVIFTQLFSSLVYLFVNLSFIQENSFYMGIQFPPAVILTLVFFFQFLFFLYILSFQL